MSQKFFQKINYSSSNEDSESERKALKLSPLDIVFCISGSGARSLDLLVDSPQKIISLDFNKTQNFILELKIAAYKHLTYKEFCQFIGLNDSMERILFFERIKDSLSDNCKLYWLKHHKLIENGILYCGTWERIQRKLIKFSFLKRKTIHKLMSINNLDAQQKLWKEGFDNLVWRFVFRIICNKFLWLYIFREPGARLIPKNFSIYTYMKSRLDYLATNFNLKTNHFANLIFQGYYGTDCVLPHHLREENFELIRDNINRIEIVTNSMSDYLSNTENRFTAFSLSDFSSYANKNEYKSCWEKIIDAAAPNARFCERQFLVKQHPETLFASIQRNAELEEYLFKTDITSIYTFCAGKIVKQTSI